MKTLGIAIPCYNEGDSINELVYKCEAISNPRIKFLIVNNGSTDNTFTVLSQLSLPPNVEVLHIHENKGYGFGILEGLKTLDTDFVGWTHADLQADPSDVLLFLPCIDGGADFMKGLRLGRPLLDRFFTGGMSVLVSAMFLKKIRDVNAQPTILDKRLLNYWKNPPKDFALDLYAYLIAVKMKCNIQRKKVFFGPRKWGNSHWNTNLFARIRFIKRTLKFAFKLRLEMR